MLNNTLRIILAGVFTCFLLFGKNSDALAGGGGGEKLDAAKVIFDHVSDAHEFHFFTINNEADPHHSFHATIPLPVIMYQKGKGFDIFLSSAFHHGEQPHNGYRLMSEDFMKESGLDQAKDEKGQPIYKTGKIYPVDEAGMPLQGVECYDLSMTKNVVQMLIALSLLVFLMLTVASKYKRGQGVNTAPKGWQNALEPVITFVRDDVAKPNLGKKADKYLPFLLTIFFFILVNNIFGLLPGAANVTGNIAFTFVLGIISFIVILFSTNKHFWHHIFWPPVPHGVKPILVPVEILGVFTKPFALIIRLFANMLAGHIIILSFIFFIFIMASMQKALGWSTSPVFIALAVFIYLLEVLVAFIQAYIFTNLSAVFIGQGFESSHDEEHHH